VSNIPLLRLICKRIQAYVLDYGTSVLSSPSGAVFASGWEVLGTLEAVAAFGRAMVRHGIVIVANKAGPAGADDGEEQGGSRRAGVGGWRVVVRVRGCNCWCN
jgi:hypothetical protein